MRWISRWLALVFVTASIRIAIAHPTTPPRAIHQPTAEWPPGRELENDLVVPVVLLVTAAGDVENASVEFGVGEPFDSIAAATARAWRFEPARDERGALSAKVRALVRFVGVEKVRAPKAPVAAPPSASPDEVAPVEVVVQGEPAPRSASEVRRDHRALAAMPHATGSDVLREVPGVFVTQHGGQGKAHQIFFRGFDAVHGQDIEFWVAGAPVNEVSNLHGQGYADLHFVIPELVRQVTARPAAYDPRQGDFAVAGSMSFDLGYSEPGLTAKLGAGSFGTRRAFVAYRPPAASERNFGAVELQDTDGFGPARAAERASGIAQMDVVLGSGFVLELMASAYAARFGSAGVLRLDDIRSGSVGRFDSYDPAQGGRSARAQLVAALRGNLGEFRLQLAPFFVRRELLIRSNYTGYLENPVTGDSVQQLHEADTLGARASARRTIALVSDEDAVEVGLLFRSDVIEQSQRRLSAVDATVTGTDVDAEVRATNIGAYVDAELRPTPRVAVRGGVRADAVSFRARERLAEAPSRSAQGSHLGLKGTLDVAITSRLRASASYGQGFRSPQARSLADGERSPFTRAESQEVGLRYVDLRGLTASLAGYRTTLSNDLVFDETTARNRSVPGTLRLGVVADLLARPVPWFSSAVAVTYTRATFRESQGDYVEGSLVPFVPQGVLRTSLGVHGVVRRLFERELALRASAGTTGLFRRPLPYGEMGSDVFLVDALAAARLREVEIGVEGFNLLDRHWNDGEFVYASSFDPRGTPSAVPVRHITAGAPRQLMLYIACFI